MVRSSTVLLLVIASAATLSGVATDARNADAAAAPSIATSSERELRQWAAQTYSESRAASARLPQTWQALESGSYDELMAGNGHYTRAFPAADRTLAAVVTYSTNASDRTVRARLEVRSADGTVRSAFDVQPYVEYDIAPDGSVVGHGESMLQAMTDGVLHTTLAFHSPDGSLIRRVESPEFSPAHSTAIVARRTFVLAVSGVILGFDITSGREIWRRPLSHRNDAATLVTAPGGDAVCAVVAGDDGKSQILLFDGAGRQRGRYALAGRTVPEGGAIFDASGATLLVRDITGDRTRIRLLDARNLRHVRTIEDE